MKTKSMIVIECSECGELYTWPRSEGRYALEMGRLHSHPESPYATTTGRFIEVPQPDPLLDPFGWAQF